MKNISLILIGILFFSFSSDHYLNKYEKKINKEIKKLFGENIITEVIHFPESLSFSRDNSFYVLKQNEQEIAYMNINKVNACKIGGCNRPDLLQNSRYDHFYYLAIKNRFISDHRFGYNMARKLFIQTP